MSNSSNFHEEEVSKIGCIKFSASTRKIGQSKDGYRQGTQRKSANSLKGSMLVFVNSGHNVWSSTLANQWSDWDFIYLQSTVFKSLYNQ